MPKGKYIRKPETCSKISVAHLGKKLSPEHKAKISKSLLGNKRRLGISHSQEIKIQIRNTLKKKTDIERFFEKVQKSDSCWLWIGRKYRNGYGRFLIGSRLDNSRREMLAHRFIYQLEIGNIPQNTFVCHKCDNPACVNPDHLFLGSSIDNVIDKVRKNRQTHPNHKGVNNPRAKLDYQKANEIRLIYGQGNITAKNLGLLYQVGETAILNIINNKRWLNP